MTTELGRRLRTIRTQKGFTQAQVGAAASRSESWANNVESGKIAEPSHPAMVAIARLLGVAPDIFVREEQVGYHALEESNEVVLQRLGAYPYVGQDRTLLDQAVAAGRQGGSIPQGQEDAVGHRRRKPQEPTLYVVRIEGNCLEPEARHGDKAIIDPNGSVHSGKMVIVDNDGQAIIKYFEEEDSVQWLLPWDGEGIRMVPDMRIVGVVLKIEREPRRGPRLKRR